MCMKLNAMEEWHALSLTGMYCILCSCEIMHDKITKKLKVFTPSVSPQPFPECKDINLKTTDLTYSPEGSFQQTH